MSELVIAIDDRRLDQLRERASQLGLTTEALVRKLIDTTLDNDETAFEEIAREIVQTHAELYRRLA